MLVELGANSDNIRITDRFGVAYVGRTEEMDRWKAPYLKDTEARTLSDVIAGADVFLGLSAAGVLKSELLSEMADTPLILALANPVPEIMPEEARRTVGRGGQGVFGRDTRFRPRFPDPSPFDPRLILRIAPAVAEAAMESGVAGRPISDMDAYADRLNRFVFRSGLIMKPVFLRGGIRLRQAGDLRRWRGRKGFARRPNRHRRRT